MTGGVLHAVAARRTTLGSARRASCSWRAPRFINSSVGLTIAGELTERHAEHVERMARLAGDRRLDVAIVNSPGGDWLATKRCYRALRAHGGATTEVVGEASSGAAIIMLAGRHRVARHDSQIMVHAISCEDPEVQRSETMQMGAIIAVRTGCGFARAMAWTEGEHWLTPIMAEAHGFIHEVRR